MYGQLCVYRQADRQTEWFQYSPKLCLQAYKPCDMVKKTPRVLSIFKSNHKHEGIEKNSVTIPN